jgi:tetratricopeptide (TPR) repeat protein
MVRDLLGKLLRPSSGAEEASSEPPMKRVGPVAAIALLAEIEGPGGRELTARVASSLDVCPGIEVRLANKRLRLPTDGTFIERLAAAGATGRGWLAQEGADVMIWGETTGLSGGAVLRFVPALLDAEGKTGTFGLADALELPANFGGEFGEILGAATVAAAVPVKLGRDETLGAVLSNAIARVNGFVESPPMGLTAAQSAAMLACLGNCFAALWRVNAKDVHLERAQRIYGLALHSCAGPELRLTRAMIQNHLAAVHEAKAANDADPAHLEEAAKAYHAVAAALGPAEHPGDWAFAQTRLGLVLYRLALKRDSDAARMQASVKAFEAARDVLDRDDSPDRWAEVTNQMGVALLALGSQVTGTEALERSVACFREALDVRRRDAAPLLWAQTANNLGAASFALSRRKTVPGLLEEAVRCFEGAREIYLKYRQPKVVAVIEKNLARVRERLSKGGKGGGHSPRRSPRPRR